MPGTPPSGLNTLPVAARRGLPAGHARQLRGVRLSLLRLGDGFACPGSRLVPW